MDDQAVNAHLVRLRAGARRIGNALGDSPDVSAVLVFGSVASGYADARSDVDLLVICRQVIPSADARRCRLASLGAAWSVASSDWENQLFPVCDSVTLGDGVRAEVHYQTAPWITAVLTQVLTTGAITTEQLAFRPYTLPALLQRAWVLRDVDGLVEQWREQTRVYPPALQRNILRHFVPILEAQVAELIASAERGLGPGSCIFHLSRAWDALNSIVLAVNAAYDPADRRMSQTVLPHLRFLPAEFARRLTAIMEGPFDAAGARRSARQLEQLAHETLALTHTLGACEGGSWP